VRGSLPWIVGTAAAAIVAAALTGAFVAGRYEGQLGQMARELAATRQRLQREVALYRNAADLLRDPTTQVVTLRGLGPSARATGRMIWHPAAGGQLVVANLPPAPPGKAYELWTIGEGAPRPAGVFRVDALGRATHRVEPVEGGAETQVAGLPTNLFRRNWDVCSAGIAFVRAGSDVIEFFDFKTRKIAPVYPLESLSRWLSAPENWKSPARDSAACPCWSPSS